MTFQWLLAGHIIFVIFWIAGLFMLPRYYVYHQEAPEGSEEALRWLEREGRLRRIILLPSVVAVWAFGLLLAWSQNVWADGWFHAKIGLVIILTAYHAYLANYGRRLARGERLLSGKTLRLMNEIPGVATALIVILVVVKPF